METLGEGVFRSNHPAVGQVKVVRNKFLLMIAKVFFFHDILFSRWREKNASGIALVLSYLQSKMPIKLLL
jgi:hypothetical protein